MRTLDELGISPAPWKRTGDWIVANANYDPIDGTTESTRVVDTKSGADARLIAAAPMLYEVAAWCKEQADKIGKFCISGGVNPYALAQCMAGISRRCEAALAAASGESEVAK